MKFHNSGGEGGSWDSKVGVPDFILKNEKLNSIIIIIIKILLQNLIIISTLDKVIECINNLDLILL